MVGHVDSVFPSDKTPHQRDHHDAAAPLSKRINAKTFGTLEKLAGMESTLESVKGLDKVRSIGGVTINGRSVAYAVPAFLLSTML